MSVGTIFSPTSMGCPASVRRLASTLSRTASWSCSGIPSSMPMTRMGICAPRSAMKSNSLAPTSGSRQLTQNARIWGSSAATRFGEKTRDIRRRWMVWTGGSSKMSTPERHLDVGPDQFDDAAAAGDEGLRVEIAPLDVGEPAHGVEVVGLVVIERRLLAQPAEDRVGVGVDRHVVGVVVHVAHTLHRHDTTSRGFMSDYDINRLIDQGVGHPPFLNRSRVASPDAVRPDRAGPRRAGWARR